MPIWKVPLITAAARKAATVAAPAVSRAVAALTNRAPAATTQVAQAAKKAAPLVTRAGGGSLRAAETLARGAAKAAPAATTQVAQAAKKVAPLVARAAPAVAVGYGLSRLNQPQATRAPHTTTQTPVVTPVTLPPTQRPLVGAPQQATATQPRVAPTAPGVTAPATTTTAPIAPTPQANWWSDTIMYTPQPTAYPQHDSGVGTGASALPGANTFAPIISELTRIVGELQSSLTRNVGEMQSPEDSAVSAHHLNQFLAETDRMGAEIRSMFEEQMGTVDPATMAALGAIRETVNQQRGRLMDDMNRRGLLQSGIWLQMEDRINNNQLSAEQQALSTRLTNLRGQMMGALQNLANARLEGTRALSIEGLRAAEDQAQRRQQATLAALGVAQDAAGQAAAQQRWAAEQATEQQRWTAEQATEQQRWTAEQTRAANEFNLRYNTLLADLTGRIPGGMPGAGQLTADAQQRAIQNAPRATQRRAGGGTAPAGTLTERTRAATADAHMAVDAAMAQGATPEAIKNNIRRQTAALIRDGVNVDSLLLYVDEVHLRNMQMRPPVTAPQNQPGLYTRIDQQLGGWLPWGAPRG